jgi:hypothetical protein
MIDRNLLSMQYVAGRITESFKTDLFVIWSEDNSEKLVFRCCVLGSPDKDDVWAPLKKPFSFGNSRTPCSTRSAFEVSRALSVYSSYSKTPFNMEASGWRRARNGSWRRTASTSGRSCALTGRLLLKQLLGDLGIEAAHKIMKELRGIIELH